MMSVSRFRRFLISCGVLALVGACATVPEERDWIEIGRTTREDVIERYGQPDLVVASGEGETATYRPGDPRGSRPVVQVPTMQAGPLGTATTKMETVDTGARSSNSSARKRPEHEIHIRYDARGVVQEVIRY
jgi:hypothetical protein